MENNKFLVHNRFDLITRDAKTLEVIAEATGYNTILDAFWTANGFLSSSRGYFCFSSMHFGSGTSDTVLTQTALQTPLGRKNCGNITMDWSKLYTDGVVSRKASIRLEVSEFVGSVIAEVGLGHDNTAGLRTRSLLADVNGNPIAITKTDSTIIDIYSTFFIKIPDTILNGKGAVKGGSLYGEERADNGFLSWIFGGSLTEAMYTKSGIPVNAIKNGFLGRSRTVAQKYALSNPAVSYDVANKKITFSIPNFTASQGNIGGITGIEMMSGLYVELPNESIPAPLIVKEVIGTGNGVLKDFSTEFKSIQNSVQNKVYVDDVEVEATIDTYYRYESNNSSYGNFGGMFVATNMISPTGEVVFENPYYSDCGVSTINQAYGWKFYVSQNGTGWTLAVTTGTGGYSEFDVPAEYQKYRYWYATKFQASASAYGITSADYNTLYGPSKNVVHLSSAPANGQTVSITYLPNCIPKNANSVFNNISLSLNFAEYTPD